MTCFTSSASAPGTRSVCPSRMIRSAPATVDLTGQGGTNFSQILTNIAANSTATSTTHTVAAGDEPRASIKIDLDHAGNPDPTAITYTASCTASAPPPGEGRIRIIKNANGGEGTFSFTSSKPTDAPSPGSITTTDGSGYFEIAVKNFPDAGGKRLDVDITELPVSGWTLDSVSCVESGGTNNSQGQLSQRQAKVSVEPDELVACTFVNTSTTTGSITIIKESNAAGTFPFSATGAGTTSFSLTIAAAGGGSASKTFSNLAASSGGTAYSFTENTPTGFTLNRVTCSGGTGITTSMTTTTVPLNPGQDVQCTYYNTADAAGLPDLEIAKSHTGNATQGQTGFQIHLERDELREGGPTLGTVTVTDTLPQWAHRDSYGEQTGWTCEI